MRNGELDLVIGGLAADVPWTSQIALTRPYTTAEGPDGAPVDLVMGVRPGENALLVRRRRAGARAPSPADLSVDTADMSGERP